MNEKNIKNEKESKHVYEIGVKHFQNGEYYEAIECFKEAIELGNFKGKYGLAKCYYFGCGLKQNYKKAYDLFYELLEQNEDIDSKYYVGLMYLNGECVEQNYGMAYNIFKELASLNDYDSRKQIAEMHYYGLYVKQDYEVALKILKKLYEEQKDESILPILAEAYYLGRGTEQNYGKAREYAELYEERNDDIYLNFMLGEIYLYGKQTEINYKKATEYFEKSIDDDYDDSFYYLGEIYEKGGYGIDKNSEISKKYFNKIEEDLCNFLIYYVLAKYDNNHLQIMINTLDRSRDELENDLKEIPQNHPSITYFNKLNLLNDEQYVKIVNLLKPKIEKVERQKEYNLFEAICNRELVNILSNIIVCSSDYNTLKEYLQDKMEKKESKILYFMGILLNVQNKEEQGWKMIEESAKQNYEYARYEIATRYYENKNLSLAEKYLISLLDITDNYLLSLVQDLLGKIYYYGGNKIKKDTEKALDFLKESNKNFDGYEKQSYNYIEKIMGDNNLGKRERDSISRTDIDISKGHLTYNRDGEGQIKNVEVAGNNKRKSDRR